MADPWGITATLAQLTTLKESLKDQTLNARAETPIDGFEKLHNLILNQIDQLEITQTLRPAVKAQISQYLSTWKTFREEFNPRAGAETHPINTPVEAWGLLWAYRSDGRLLWTLKVIWDSDWPAAGENILPHFGFEVIFNGQRNGRIGHVFLTRSAPRAWRDGNRMHEVAKGVYTNQWVDSREGTQVRCDGALRLWACVQDGELAQYASSDQEYNQTLHAPPRSWERFPLPSFGRNG